MGGIAAAQGFTLLISPLLTRLYTPHDFGVLSLVLGAGSLIGSAVHGRLTLAIARSNSLDEGLEVVDVALLISVVGAFFAGLGIWTVAQIVGSSVYTLPVVSAIVFMGICAAHIDIFNYWQSFTGAFYVSAKNAASRSIMTGVAQLLLSIFGAVGLTIGAITGALMSVSNSYRLRKSYIVPSVQKIRHVLTVHKSYPFYSMPQGLLASASLNGIPLLLANFYGAGIAGQYWLAYRVLLAPIALIGGSYRQVFHAQLSGTCRDLSSIYGRAFKHTVIMAFVIMPFALLTFAYGVDVFRLAFGEKWEIAGLFSGYLVICFSMDILKVPAISILHSLNKQRFLLEYEAVLAVLRLGLVAYFCMYDDALIAIQVFAAISACAAFFLIVFSYRVSRVSLKSTINDQ